MNFDQASPASKRAGGYSVKCRHSSDVIYAALRNEKPLPTTSAERDASSIRKKMSWTMTSRSPDLAATLPTICGSARDQRIGARERSGSGGMCSADNVKPVAMTRPGVIPWAAALLNARHKIRSSSRRGTAQSLWTSPRKIANKKQLIPTRLTQRRRSEGSGKMFAAVANPAPTQVKVCEVAGAKGVRNRYCPSCAVEVSREHMAQVAVIAHAKPKNSTGQSSYLKSLERPCRRDLVVVAIQSARLAERGVLR